MRIDPRLDLSISTAGHPPALLVRDGNAIWLASDGVALGWPGATGGARKTERLQQGDLLVVYTDGLVESRKDVTDGMERLGRAALDRARPHGRSAQGTADELVEEMLQGAEHCDDTLALVVRGQGGHSGRP
ncbi:MAG: serine/threonine-protein phosphatase [Actinomycetota bacterium]|nr:serine/threonine-protein phosphatase [Actinomycetota bacterium]